MQQHAQQQVALQVRRWRACKMLSFLCICISLYCSNTQQQQQVALWVRGWQCAGLFLMYACVHHCVSLCVCVCVCVCACAYMCILHAFLHKWEEGAFEDNMYQPGQRECTVGYLYHHATRISLNPSRCVGSNLISKLQGPCKARIVIN